ncbi:MAG: CoA pyrophosphatase [Candidatus Binatia bacterium]
MTLQDIKQCLDAHDPEISTVAPEKTRVRAAVAIIARQAGDDVEILYIRRSEFDGDPWSGDIAFPGGRIDTPEEPPRAAAERETIEEVGIELGDDEYLGRIDDVTGRTEAVLVSGFVYGLRGPVELTPNHEVAATRWVAMNTLVEPSRQVTRSFKYLEHDVQMPALQIFDDHSPVLWGLTYRFTEIFMQLLDRPIPGMHWRTDLQ